MAYNGASMAQLATAHGLGNLNYIHTLMLPHIGKPAKNPRRALLQVTIWRWITHDDTL